MSEEQPFSHPVNVRTLPKKGRRERYEAPDSVCAKIAAAYDLIGVAVFAAKAEIAPWKGRGVRVRGEIIASLSQPCAATSEPLDVAMNETFEATYVPEGSRLTKPRLNEVGEMVLDAEGEDPPEVFTGDSLDLANIWLEQFALCLDPFARVEGASPLESITDDEPAKENPFAALAALKGN
jgi:uncharacterized metal-binding protein YceD (DUF177 family)